MGDVYVLLGASGKYEDYRERMVRAFRVPEAAAEYRTKAQAEEDRLSAEHDARVDRWSDRLAATGNPGRYPKRKQNRYDRPRDGDDCDRVTFRVEIVPMDEDVASPATGSRDGEESQP